MNRDRRLQAIIFDFDGVIANSEPMHLRAFQDTIAEEDIVLSAEDYFARYLGFDDVGAFQAMLKDSGRRVEEALVRSLVARKGARMDALMHSGALLFPGVVDFIRETASIVPLAIASGALRHEIEAIVSAAGIADCFQTVVASGDTPESKPSPAPYRLAFERLRTHTGMALDGRRSVAIEDSRWGLASARGAGLRCVGVTTSYPASELSGAELIVGGVADLTIDMLDELCADAV